MRSVDRRSNSTVIQRLTLGSRGAGLRRQRQDGRANISVGHGHTPTYHMQETLWVLGFLLAAAAYVAATTVAPDQLVFAGQYVMFRAAAVGVPLELVYFALLAWALRANHNAPTGWYWRSYESHSLLHQWQRYWIMPPFYLGALAFLGIVLGIVISLLGFVTAIGFRTTPSMLQLH